MIRTENFSQKLNQFSNSFSTDPYFYWINFLKYKRQLLFISFLIGLLSLFISKNIQPIFQSHASLILNNQDNNIINIEQVYSDLAQSNNNISFLNTQKGIIGSNEILNRLLNKDDFVEVASNNYSDYKKTTMNKIINFFGYKKEEEINKNKLKEIIKSNLSITNQRDTNIIELKYDAYSKEFSRLVLEKLIITYLEYDIDQKISVTTYANTKIKERLNELKNNLEASEQALQIYKKDNKLIDLGDIKDLKNEEIKSISSRILKAEKELQELQNNLQQISLTSDDIEELASLKIIKDQKEVDQILSNLEANSNTIDSLKLVYTNNHPKLNKAIKTEDNLKNKLNSIIQDNIASMAYEVANLQSFIDLSEKELEKARQELQDLEIQDLDMQQFTREVDLNKRIYESFLERLKETTEAKELQTPNAKVLDRPNTLIAPIFPKVEVITSLSFILTFMILYFLIIYYETFRNVISDPSMLDENNFDLLNIIPKTGLKKGYHLPMNFLEKNSDKFSESILSLKTILLSKFNQSKVFMITSPVSGEGKTTISLNLALSLSINNKVLFLETDFRRPSLMKSLNQEYRDGLIELFLGKVKFSEIKFSIYSTELDVVSAGKPSNFNKMIDTEKLKKFISLLKNKYDYIIVDTAPILPVADTLSLADIADTILLIVRSDYTKIAGLINARNKIKSVSSSELATVLNYFDTENINYYNYSNYGSYYKNYYNYSS